MIDAGMLPELKAGDTFAIDLMSLAQEFMETDEFDELARDGGDYALGRDMFLAFEPNESEPDNPYIDFHMDGQVVAMDGEEITIIENDVANSRMSLRNDDGEVTADFDLDYGTLAACIGNID